MKLRKVKKQVKKFLEQSGSKILATHGRTFVVNDSKPKSRLLAPFIIVTPDHHNLNEAIRLGKLPLDEWKEHERHRQYQKRMKLQPYNYGPKDTWLPPGEFSYYEKVDDEGYFYEVYALMNTRKVRIVITDNGVSIECKNKGDVIFTDIDPSMLFPNKKSLTWGDLSVILNKIDDRDHESEFTSGKKMNEMYEYWKTNVKDKDL